MAFKTIQEINQYIGRARKTVKPDYRPKYHMTPPVGWMNDPNGLIFYGGKYRLFYQFNPYDTQPGTMLWGEFLSDDLIRYTDAGAVIAPREENASIYSGGAIEYDGRLLAMYTEHSERGGEKREETYASFSTDGVGFSDRVKLFANENLPPEISRTDFRDPYPVRVGDRYYVLVGGKNVALNRGVIVVLGGDSPLSLEYKFTIGPFYELGDMGECPSWRRVDGKDVILVSGCHVPARGNDFRNENSSVFLIGELDFEKGRMTVESIREIDKGDCFYAPQFVNGTDEAVMIGWQEMWGKLYPTHDRGHGWVGSFSVPRRLAFRDGELLQIPVSTLDGYEKPWTGSGLPACADISLAFDGDASATIVGREGAVKIGCKEGRAYLDTTRSDNGNGCVRYTDRAYGACRVRVLLDVSSIEVFVEGGAEAISSRIYIGEELSLSLHGSVRVESVKKVEIG